MLEFFLVVVSAPFSWSIMSACNLTPKCQTSPFLAFCHTAGDVSAVRSPQVVDWISRVLY